MNRERTDLDIPEGTVWPASEESGSPDEGASRAEGSTEGTTQGSTGGSGEDPPMSLDPDRDTAERNAAAGGWDGANEQIENDFETEQLRQRGANADEELPPA